MPDYLNSKLVSKILGCSMSTAREIMNKLPCFRPSGRKRGSQMYVKKSDLDDFVANNTTLPGTSQPRLTEWTTKKTQQSANLKEWHRGKRLA